MRLSTLPLALVLLASGTYAEPAGGLYPPGLLPLINRANALLSTGQFNEAAKIYSEAIGTFPCYPRLLGWNPLTYTAIEQSPADYLLYYKRATAYYSLSRHGAALDDFDKVLSLTSNTFDNAHLMKARIHTKAGDFTPARTSLAAFTKKSPSDSSALELSKDIEEGEAMAKKAAQERKAHLWNACIESSGAALRIASHSIEIRQARAECALGAGDIESATGDLTYVHCGSQT